MENESESQSSKLNIWSKNSLKTPTGQLKMWKEFLPKLGLRKHRFTNGIGTRKRS